MKEFTAKPSEALDRNMHALRVADPYLQQDAVKAWCSLQHHRRAVRAKAGGLGRELEAAKKRGSYLFELVKAYGPGSQLRRAEQECIALVQELETTIANYLADPLTRERVEDVVRRAAALTATSLSP